MVNLLFAAGAIVAAFVVVSAGLVLAGLVLEWIGERRAARGARSGDHVSSQSVPNSGRPVCSRCGKAQVEEVRAARSSGGATVFLRCPVCSDTTVQAGVAPVRREGP